LTGIAYSAPIVVRFSGVYPTYFVENGEKQGMDVDIVTQVLSRAGLEHLTVSWPFKRSLLEVEQGNIDIMTNLTRNAERSEYMTWIGPVRYTSIALIVPTHSANLSIKESSDLLRLSESTGLKFGDIVGASYSDSFEELKSENRDFKNIFEYVAEPESNYKKLTAGRILGFFADDFEFSSLLNKANQTDDLINDFAIHSFRVDGSQGGAYIGISKKLSEERIQLIKQAFYELIADGTLETIHKKWAGEPLPARLIELVNENKVED
jgi:ABC-type amino acid transport substrate-binding protein